MSVCIKRGGAGHCLHTAKVGIRTEEVKHGKFPPELIAVDLEECCACGEQYERSRSQYRLNFVTGDKVPCFVCGNADSNIRCGHGPGGHGV